MARKAKARSEVQQIESHDREPLVYFSGAYGRFQKV